MIELSVEDRRARVKEATERLNKQSPGLAMVMGENLDTLSIQTIPTPSISLNLATGIGGVPRGRITEIYGVENSGKTGLALGLEAEAQKQGGVVIHVNAEYALDEAYARLCGVNIHDLVVVSPTSGEEAMDAVETYARAGADLIVVDSVAALAPTAEIESEMSKQSVGAQARLMSKALRKLVPIAGKYNTALVFLNQIRSQVGGPPGASNETTPGGKALRFFSSLRMEVRRGETLRQGDTVIGHVVRVKITKNRLGVPLRRAQYPVLYGVGINQIGELIPLATEAGLLKFGGGWRVPGYQDDADGKAFRLCDTKDALPQALADHPEVTHWLMEHLDPKILNVASEDETDVAS